MFASRRLALFALVGLAYAGGSQLAFAWFGADGTNASFFPAAGVTFAALAFVAWKEWPVVILAAGSAEFLIDLAHDISVRSTAGYVVANLAQPIVGAWLLRRLVRDVDLARTAHLVLFVICGTVIAPMVGGALGATNHVLNDPGGGGWLRFALEWWIGDGLGILVVGGALLGWLAAPSQPSSLPRPVRTLESAALLAGLVVSTFVVFRLELFGLASIPVAFVMAVAARVRTRGVAVAGACAGFLAATFVAGGHNFWHNTKLAPQSGLVYLQLAMAVVFTTAFALAAEITSREAAALATARAQAAREEEHLAARRADDLRRFAESVADAVSVEEIQSRVQSFGYRSAVLGASGASVVDDAVARIVEHAVHRVQMLEEERFARHRAEQSERFAVALGKATTVAEVAAATTRALVDAGLDAAWIWHGSADPGTSPMAEDVRSGLATPPVPAEAVLHASDAAGTSRRADVDGTTVLQLRSASGAPVAVLAVAPVVAAGSQLERLLLEFAEKSELAMDRAELQQVRQDVAADDALLALIGEEMFAEMDVESRCRRVIDVLWRERRFDVTIRMSGDSGEVGEPLDLQSPDGSGWRIVRPLLSRGRLIGELDISAGPIVDGGAPQRMRRQFLDALTTRVAIGLDNAAMYERERDASHALQMGLLGTPLPTMVECELAGAYRPATASLEVGGDWYDAFWLPNDHVALVVGDVVGHGLDAAIAMGHVRGAVRTLARFAEPAELLTHLDDFVLTVPGAQSATVAYIEYDPESGQMWYASAGHPPPLLVSPGGHARYLWDGRSQPLGFGRGQARVQASGMVGNEGVLLLYTDGLIERRTASLDRGLQRLLTALEEDWRKPPQDLTDLLLQRMTGSDETGDDVCMLAMRAWPTRPSFYFAFIAAPMEIARCRHGLRDWLRRQDVPRDDEQLVLLAVGEAVSNAVEHGHSRAPGLVEVAASINARGEVFVSVMDSGQWIHRPPTPGRGRGLHIMEATMDRVERDTSGIGTEIRLMRRLGVDRPAV